MHARSLRRLPAMTALVVAATIFAGLPIHAGWSSRPGHVPLADPFCPNGTNWDSVLHICR